MLSAQLKARKARESLKTIVNNAIGGGRGSSPSAANQNCSQQSESSCTSTFSPATASKWSDVKRRVTAAASIGLSKSARSSHIAPASASNLGGGPVDTDDETPPIGGYGDDSVQQHQHPEDAFALRRRQTLWQCNHTESPLFFQRRCATALPAPNQEQLLIGELLDCLVGIAGTFVRPVDRHQQPGGVGAMMSSAFTISDQINCSMRDLAAPLLLMGTHYTIIDDFCVLHSNEYRGYALTGSAHRSGGGSGPRGSQVLQALASTLRQLKQDYLQTVVTLQADAAELTLSKLVHLLRPARHSLSVLAQIVDAVTASQLRGAGVLSMLHRQIRGALGDEVRQQVLEHLLEQAAEPYVRTLQLWIVKGVVYDPHLEFMIEERELRCGEPAEEETYWGYRYRLRQDRTPDFFNDVQNEVQRTGKYLNVMRQCGYSVDGRSSEERDGEAGEAAATLAESEGGMGGETLRYSATSNEHLVSNRHTQ